MSEILNTPYKLHVAESELDNMFLKPAAEASADMDRIKTRVWQALDDLRDSKPPRIIEFTADESILEFSPIGGVLDWVALVADLWAEDRGIKIRQLDDLDQLNHFWIRI